MLEVRRKKEEGTIMGPDDRMFQNSFLQIPDAKWAINWPWDKDFVVGRNCDSTDPVWGNSVICKVLIELKEKSFLEKVPDFDNVISIPWADDSCASVSQDEVVHGVWELKKIFDYKDVHCRKETRDFSSLCSTWW